MESIFQYNNYRSYLNDRLGHSGQRTGRRKSFAEALGTHSSFVSQILQEKSNLSLDQAEMANTFFKHDIEEAEYFLLLVSYDHAATVALKSRYQIKLDAMRKTHLEVQTRVGQFGKISKEDQEKFYSNYLYGALHVLVSIPHFQTRDSLLKFFNIPAPRLHEALDFLIRLKIITENNAKLSHGSVHIHLPRESPLITMHHTNWHLHALSKIAHPLEHDLHYSSAFSLSREDAIALKEFFLKTIEKAVKRIGPSACEEAYVLNIDYYKL